MVVVLSSTFVADTKIIFCHDFVAPLKAHAIKPCLWKRFIDDIFFLWANSVENLNKFLKDLNKFHPNHNFTDDKSEGKNNFLNVAIKLITGKIATNPYCKPTDSH